MATIEQALKFADVSLEVQVELGRTRLKLREILEFRVGGVLRTGRLASDGVEVRVGGVRVGSARIVVSDNRVAVRLTSLDLPRAAAHSPAISKAAGKS